MKCYHVIICAGVLAAFVSTHVYGQLISAGVKGGISIPNIRGNSEQSKGYSSRQGAYFGLLINRKMSDNFSLQTEINYSPQGGQRNKMQPVPAGRFSDIMLPPGTVLYADFRNKTILDYLEIPILGQLTLHKANRIHYHLKLGPYIAYLVKATTITSGTSSLYLDATRKSPLILQDGTPLPPVSFDSKTNINDEIKKINAGFTGGVDVEYVFDCNKIFVEGRFTLGLTNIQTNTEENGKNHTGSVIIALGYAYCFKNKL